MHAAANYGFKTIWVNRFNGKLERLPGKPEAIVKSLNDIRLIPVLTPIHSLNHTSTPPATKQMLSEEETELLLALHERAMSERSEALLEKVASGQVRLSPLSGPVRLQLT